MLLAETFQELKLDMKNKLILAFILLIAILGATAYGVLNYSYSKGVRTGKLVKLSKKGMLLKTYEGTLDLGSGDRLTWDFSIHDDKLGDNLVKSTGQVVQLEYREILFKLFYLSKYDVTKWSLITAEKDMALLCRLVDAARRGRGLVGQLRALIMQHDPGLLPTIRRCQK
jgi:hypothetical protein